jgi:hypothetical protein
MAVELTSSALSVSFQATLTDLGQTAATCVGSVQTGNEFPTLSAPMTTGTASKQGNLLTSAKYTIAGGANQDIDLSGSLLSPANLSAVFTKVKQVVVAIDSPDGTKKVRVGPQGVTNGCQLWFGGVGAQAYEEVVEFMLKTDRFTGWTVTPGTGDILRINNPTGVSVDVYIAIIGLS